MHAGKNKEKTHVGIHIYPRTCMHIHTHTHTYIYILRSIDAHTLIYIDIYCYTFGEASLGQKEAQEGPEEAEDGHKRRPKTAKRRPKMA